MRLSDCLNYADIDTLRKIAEHYDFQCTKHSKLSLHQEISYNFRISSFLSEQTECWVKDRETGLLRMVLESDRPYTVEELRSWLSSDQSIEEAVEEGWLFPTSRLPDSRKLYCVPEELRLRLHTYLMETFRKQLQVADEPPLIYSDEQNLLAQDLDVFLEYVRNHEVTLTQDGTMYKRHLLRILEMMQIEEEPLTGGWRFGYGRRFHDYPNRFALLYDFAYANDYIDETDSGLLSVTETSNKWTEATSGERIKHLLAFYVSCYRRAILRLPVILRVMALTNHQWISEESMLQAVQPYLNDYYYDSTLDIWQKRILSMLQHLGLIRRGEDENAVRWFQTTDIGQQLLATGEIPEAGSNATAQKVLIVQPNFNILATANQPAVTAELAQIANLHESGAVRVYRLSQQSFARGLHDAGDGAKWIDFLQNHSQTAIPGNVEKTLLEWLRLWTAEQQSMTS